MINSISKHEDGFVSCQQLIGIDLGGTNCRAAIVSSDGAIGRQAQIPTAMTTGLDEFIERLAALCRELEDEPGVAPPSAIGIGTPGLIAPDGTVRVSPNLPDLNGVSFANRVSEALGLPVAVVNDANAIAWGERFAGAGRPFASSLTLTLGTGVGGGLILNGALWEGPDGSGGEAGHIMVEPDGPRCGCGSRGCLEQYASARGIVQTVRRLLAGGGHSVLMTDDPAFLGARRIAEAAGRGDALALEAFAEAGRRLGQALGGIINLLNLDGVVIAGGVSASFNLLQPALEEELARRSFALPAERCRVVPRALGEHAGLIGAARLAFERHLSAKDSLR
jgi:glucokinase